MAFCGYNTRMVEGLSIFAEGIFQATLDRARERQTSIKEAFEDEVAELGSLLKALEERYQAISAELGDGASDRDLVMGRLADWLLERELSSKGAEETQNP